MEDANHQLEEHQGRPGELRYPSTVTWAVITAMPTVIAVIRTVTARGQVLLIVEQPRSERKAVVWDWS